MSKKTFIRRLSWGGKYEVVQILSLIFTVFSLTSTTHSTPVIPTVPRARNGTLARPTFRIGSSILRVGPVAGKGDWEKLIYESKKKNKRETNLFVWYICRRLRKKKRTKSIKSRRVRTYIDTYIYVGFTRMKFVEWVG